LFKFDTPAPPPFDLKINRNIWSTQPGGFLGFLVIRTVSSQLQGQINSTVIRA